MQRAAQKDVACDRRNIAGTEGHGVADSGILIGDPRNALSDHHVFHDKFFDMPLVTHAEHDGVLEMHGGGSAFAQSLMRACDVVVEAGIEIVYGDGLFEQLDRRPVSPRCLINDSEKIEARRVRGRLRQDLLADDLGLRQPMRTISFVGLCHQPGNVGWLGALRGLGARGGGSALTSVHNGSRSVNSRQALCYVNASGAHNIFRCDRWQILGIGCPFIVIRRIFRVGHTVLGGVSR
ncbi:MAG: hypothetical protein WA808_10505 [Xanthobacteraceae bacterium]